VKEVIDSLYCRDRVAKASARGIAIARDRCTNRQQRIHVTKQIDETSLARLPPQT
jgi:hypothetical protein